MNQRVAIEKFDSDNLRNKIRDCLEWINWRDKIYPDSRIYIKPNLTFPEYREGVTTSPEFITALLDVLKERTAHLAVFESDGGNNSYPAEKAFRTHHLYEICSARNVRLLNLSRLETVPVPVITPHGTKIIPLAKELVENADMTISVPVPKMHFVTRFTGAIKNHWGCVPDSMRLRNHYFFSYAILEIMRRLKSQITVVDGQYFLDVNGPVTGTPVKMDLVIAAESPLAADLILMDIMNVDPHSIGYIRQAWKQKMLPESTADIEINHDIKEIKTHQFSYKRDPVDYLALLGFKSRIVTWIVYLSPLRSFAHWLVKMLRGGSRQVDTFYKDVLKDDEPG
ncbi:MAG: DUF362 domain-containing protein [Candidatus Neomarinimicrobiota bacterium]